MDKLKENKKNRYPTDVFKNKFILGGTLMLVLAITAFFRLTYDDVTVRKTEILTDVVKSGELEIAVDGYGKLRSNSQKLITAVTPATVKEVLLKPGALVSQDSIILKLENNELAQSVEMIKQKVLEAEASLRQLKVNQIRELLAENAELEEVKAEHESIKLKREAEAALAESGIVPDLVYKQTQLKEEQLKARVEILIKKIGQLSDVHQEAEIVLTEKLKQQQARLNIIQEHYDKLTVRAEFDGVLQRLSVELGQSIVGGQEIALLGSMSDLVAVIKVPQNQVDQISIGQQSIIEIRGDNIRGQVVRIEPMVVNNTVEVEIDFPEDLPASARPEMNVDAKIIIDTVKNAHYINLPFKVSPEKANDVYVLNDSLSSAELRSIRFGRQAGRYIEIVSGVATGENLIISDASHYTQITRKIVIK